MRLLKGRSERVEELDKIAYVFPGQGSQYVGMGKDLCEQFSVAKQVFIEAEESLGMALRNLCFSGPESDLKLTQNTQPAILTASVAGLRVLESETCLKPAFVAGHSLGEYSALVCVGALEFRDAVRVVRERGRMMQEAVPLGEGSMAVLLGLETDAVQAICNDAGCGEVVAPANYNGGGQIVIAGAKNAVARAMAMAKERGAKRAIELPVSAPFHCPLMQPAADGLRQVLANIPIYPYSVGVITNAEAEANLDVERVKPLLTEQAVRPVRWEESVRKLEQLGCRRLLEIGPGKVLKGLIKRICPAVQVDNLDTAEDFVRIAAEQRK
jgi:[acyl-carrier-protein] S-malonyltransferase